MQIRTATLADIDTITAIYNQGIRAGTGTFDTNERAPDEIALWLAKLERYPCLVIEQSGIVKGWARLFEYRPRACYAGIAEFSIYLDEAATGRGLGKHLLRALLEAAKERGFHKVLSRIFTFNQASRALCASLGFREVGIYQKHGRIGEQWADVVIVEYLTSHQT